MIAAGIDDAGTAGAVTTNDSETFCGLLLARLSVIGIVAVYVLPDSDPTATYSVMVLPITLVVIAVEAVPVIVPTSVVPSVAPFADVTVMTCETTAPDPASAVSDTDDADNAIVGVGGGDTAATFSVTVMFCGVLLAVASTIGTVAVYGDEAFVSAAEAPVTVTTLPVMLAVTPVAPVPVIVPTDSAPNAAAVPLVTMHVPVTVAAFPCCTERVMVGFDSTIDGTTAAVTANVTVSVCGELVAFASCTGIVAL